MKRSLIIFSAIILCAYYAAAQTPNFALVGFATQNGGTKGGQGGTTVTATNYAQLKSYAESAAPYIILVQGTMSNGTGGGQIRVQSNKSIIGVGSTAFLSGVGIDITSQNNIIIQNLKITLVGTSTPYNVNGGDCIGIQGTSKNIWIDHCELYSENPNTQTNIDKYDGLLDIKQQTGWITISWCYFHDHHKGGLVGAADNDLNNDRKVTLHHNYYKNVKLRVPMYRGSVGHFFNNYIVSAKDASEIRAGTCVRIEKNYYEALHYSIYTTSDSPGKAERIDNIEVQRTSRAYPANCTADIPYNYSAVLTTNTNDVKTVVPQYSGVGKIGNTTPCTAPTATVTAGGATTFCQGKNVVLNANTGTGLSYQWKNGSNNISGATTASYTATASGSYSVTVTNAASCSANAPAVSVTVNALPAAVITSASGTVIPYGSNLLLTASAGSGYTYQWKNNTTNISGATASSYTATAAGSYTVTVSAASCSATSAALVLTKESGPLKYIYTYDNSGNLSWSNTNSWAPKAVPRSIDTVIIRSGEVQINALTHTAPVYVETNGTLRLVTANSTINNLRLQGGTLKVFTSTPELALTSDITVEQPSTIMAGSVAATIFTLNGTITGNANLTKTSVGILRINSTATGFKGNWIVTEGKLQLRSATGLGVCGVQVKATARLDIETAGASVYSLVLEENGGVDLDQNLNVSVAVFGASNILTGAYKNADYPAYIGGTGTLNLSNSIITTSGATTFCPGGSVTLTSSSGTSYSWKNNTTQTATTAAYIANSAGAYNVTVTNSNGCKITSAPVVTTLAAAQPTPTITAPATSFCAGGSATLTASAGASYKWFNGTSQVGTAVTYTATTAGSYTVEVTNAAGCKAGSAPTTITISPAPVWYEDTDGDGKGNTAVTQTACTQPTGYVSVDGDACPADAAKTAPGNCGCGNTETSCLDCAGTPNGTAFLDNCSICVGGTTGNTACVTTTTVNGSSIYIKVIPQPFDNSTNISVENIGMIQSITIISSTGKIVDVKQQLNSDNVTIGNELATGMYSVLITTEKGTYNTKIVKQ